VQIIMIHNEKNTYDNEHEFESLDKPPMPFILNQSNELFNDDEALKQHRIINVRRIVLPRNGENWEVLDDGRKVLVLRGVRLTKREKGVLRTVEGIRMVIEEYKAGNSSIAKIKNKLRKYWKEHCDKI